ncbi:MAG: hypothetical protein HY769_07285, partial [Candidatus Stahlbacteria bacterium]|nr:hypothetical protein [Candidatus Stahlbacteria bacterium]
MQNLLLNLVSIFCVSTTDAKIASVPPQYLIITADVFYDAILPLAEWKTKKGVPAKVVKLSTISNPIHPYQTPDSIYNYIHSYFGQSDPPPEYLLLVGDAEFMPAYGYGGTTGAPCDHMYSLHTGNDHLSDILIARLPAQTVNDCITMVQKLLEYECNPPMSVPESYRKATSFSMGWWVTLQGNINKCLRDLGYAQIDSLGDATRDTMISNRINDGRSIFYYLGHAGPCGFNISGFDCADARALTNRKILCPVVLVSNACHTAYFKYDCLGEAFLRQENGAIGYWGAITRSDFGPAGDTCTIAFYYGLKQGIYNFQKLCNFGKSYMCKYFDPNTDGITQKTMYSLTTLGDPELPIWTDIPCTLFVTHTGFAPLGSSNFKVTVKNNTTPLENALVCVMKGSEVYVSGYTTAAGEIILAITPATMGNLTITVTAHNFLPYIGYALVGGSGVSYIKDSLSDPAPEGNNNGDLNPGEQVNLFVTVKNYSQEQVTNATAELIIHNPLITMITGTQGLGDIPANVEVTNSLPFKFKLSESALDGQVLSCSLKVTSGISGWYSEFEIPIVGVPSINVIPPQLSFFYHIGTKDKGTTIKDTILYDDNSASSSSQAFTSTKYYGVKFTPTANCSVKAGQIYLRKQYSDIVELRLYADSNGVPGRRIDKIDITVDNTPKWYYKTFTTPLVTDKDFWLVAFTNSIRCYGDPAGTGRSYQSSDSITWAPVSPSADLFIRAEVDYFTTNTDSGLIGVKNIGTGMLNVNSITLKQSSTWITDLQPLNMNVNIGDSDAICVKIDTTGISTDIAYWDTVLISS